MEQSNALSQTRAPEAVAAIWARLEGLARTIKDDETRAQYLAAWRARYDAAFPAADPLDADDAILPNGAVVGEPNEKERGVLGFVAVRWWRREIERLNDNSAPLSAGALKAIAFSCGGRVAAGMLERAAIEADIPHNILSQPAWAKAFAQGMKRGFIGAGQLLALRCSAYPLTEYGMAERFRDREGQNFRYTTGKGWLGWDGKRWKVLDQEQNALPAEVIAAVFATVRAVQDEARLVRASGAPAHSLSDKQAEAYLAADMINDRGYNWAGVRARDLEMWGRGCETNGLVSSVARLVTQWISCRIEDFDLDHMAVNCQNGTLRFERGDDGSWMPVIHPHDRGDLMTRVAAVAYDVAADAPLFDKLIRWAQPPRDRRRYVRQWLGYCLSGHTGAQILQFWHGKGANAKSTVIDACASAMGDYSGTILIESFLDQGIKKRGESASPDLAKLGGVRLLRTSEPEDRAQLNEALVKLVTGQEPFSVRALHKGFFDLRPAFKLTISGNNPLVIKGTDEGIWRRLKQVPWESFMPEDQKDLELPTKLRGELPGIFAWMVRGLCDWLEHGFIEPGSVTQATAAWRDDSDPVGKFLKQCTQDDPTSRVQSSLLHQVYVAWAKVADEYEMKNKSLAIILKKKGLKFKSSNGNHVLGIKLLRSVGDFVDQDGKPVKLVPDLVEAGSVLSGDGPDAAPDWADDHDDPFAR